MKQVRKYSWMIWLCLSIAAVTMGGKLLFRKLHPASVVEENQTMQLTKFYTTVGVLNQWGSYIGRDFFQVNVPVPGDYLLTFTTQHETRQIVFKNIENALMTFVFKPEQQVLEASIVQGAISETALTSPRVWSDKDGVVTLFAWPGDTNSSWSNIFSIDLSVTPIELIKGGKVSSEIYKIPTPPTILWPFLFLGIGMAMMIGLWSIYRENLLKNRFPFSFFRRPHSIMTISLVLIILFLYHPVKNYIPDFDHVAYLVDTLKYDNFSDLLVRFYSYNRVRVVFPGDTLLFRPMLFGMLALEKALFGSDLMKWQFFAIGLHLLTTLLFIRLLWIFKPSYFAYVPGAFFALSVLMQPVISKINVTGYIGFVCLVILALIHLKKYSQRSRRLSLIIAVFCSGLACFTYELGNILSLLFCIYLYALKRDKLAIAFTIPVGLYGILSYLDYKSYLTLGSFELAVNQYEDARILAMLPKFYQICRNFFGFNRQFLSALFFLGGRDRSVADMIVSDGELFVYGIFFSVSIAYIAGSVFVNLKTRKRSYWIDAILGGLMLFAYLSLIIVGRVLPRGQEGVQHYGYLYLFFFLLLIYIIIDLDTFREFPILNKISMILCGIVLLMNYFTVSEIHAQHTTRGFMRNSPNIQLQNPVIPGFLQQLQTFVDTNKKEANFSFAVDQQTNQQYAFYGIPLAMIFFHRYYQECPQYIVSYEHNRLNITRNAQNMHFPILVDFTGMSPHFTPYTGYNIFQYRNAYYGVPFEEAFLLEQEGQYLKFVNISLSEVKNTLHQMLLQSPSPIHPSLK